MSDSSSFCCQIFCLEFSGFLAALGLAIVAELKGLLGHRRRARVVVLDDLLDRRRFVAGDRADQAKLAVGLEEPAA